MEQTTPSKYLKPARKQNNLPQVELSEKSSIGLRFVRECDPLSEPGIRLEVVTRLLGHKTTKLTSHYAKLLEKNIIKECVREGVRRGGGKLDE